VIEQPKAIACSTNVIAGLAWRPSRLLMTARTERT